MEQLYTKFQTLTIGVVLSPFLFSGHQIFFFWSKKDRPLLKESSLLRQYVSTLGTKQVDYSHCKKENIVLEGTCMHT